MPKALRLTGLAAVFALGVLLAWTVGAAGRLAETTTVDTTAVVETTTAAETTTEPSTTSETVTDASSGTTVLATTTLQVTTTRFVPVTTSSSSEDDTPAWVWALIAILAVGLIALILLLARRGRGGVSADERRRHLDGAVASWAAQGWAIESETADSAVLRRGGEAMLVSVDAAGHVSTRPLPGA
jgi:hypothetical protein